MKRMKKVLSWTLCVLLLILSTSPIKADQPDGPVIKLAYQPSVAGASVMVALEMGYFADEGLNVQTLFFNSGTLINKAMASGQAVMGVMGDVPSVIAVSLLPVTIVATIGGGACRERVMVQTDSALQSILELEGKKVGLTRGTSGHMFWYRIAWRDGLDPESVRQFDIQPAEMVEALATGQIDAAVLWEPWPTIVEQRGIGRAVGCGEGTGNDYPYQLMVNTRFAQDYPRLVQAFLKALVRGNQFILDNPEQTAVLIGNATGLDLAVASRSMEFHFFEIKMDEQIKSSLKQTATFLRELGYLTKEPDWDKAIDESFLDQLE
jgi:sulfonate transport system substrate-binding protein